MKNKFQLFLVFFFICNFSRAQCDSLTLYTKDIGDGFTQYNVPFKCLITKDKILFESVMENNQPPGVRLAFKIESGNCKWENGEGVAIFKVVLEGKDKPKPGIINIRSKDKQGRIQILYTGTDEARVLNIKY